MQAATATRLAVPETVVRRRRGPEWARRVLRSRLAVPAIIVLLAVVLCAIGGNVVAPYDPFFQDYASVLEPPSRAHLMGTDDIGRDVLSRVIHGSRISVSVGLVAVALAMLIGVPLGLLAAYTRGWLDDVLMRVVGAGPLRIIRLHIWPNATAPIIVLASLRVASAIITEAGLSFLGAGVPPPTPSWGSMLRASYQYTETAPWLAIFPGIAIFLTVLATNIVGDALRSALDPRMQGRD